MNWSSTGDFLAMGGYGLYVWGSYGLVALWMVAEPFMVARRHRQALRQLAEPTEEDT